MWGRSCHFLKGTMANLEDNREVDSLDNGERRLFKQIWDDNCNVVPDPSMKSQE